MIESLVSAIIVTHNRKELLLKAINSVLTQSYKNIECIVVDDASKDGTRDALNELIKENKIKYIYIKPEESKGGNYARNVGVSNSLGGYIAFLDDDDEWFDNKIQLQVAAVADNEESGFVYCAISREFIKNGVTYKRLPSKKEGKKDGDLSREVLIHTIALTSTIMVRRDVLDKVGFFDETLKYWQDYELCIRILQETKATYVNEVLVKYRVIEDDSKRLSNKIDGWESAVEYILHKHMKYYETLLPEEEGLRKWYYYMDGINRAKKVKSVKYLIRYTWCLFSDQETRNILSNKIKNRLKYILIRECVI